MVRALIADKRDQLIRRSLAEVEIRADSLPVQSRVKPLHATHCGAAIALYLCMSGRSSRKRPRRSISPR